MSNDTEVQKAEIVEAEHHQTTPDRQNGTSAAPITLFGSQNPDAVIESATATAKALTKILEDQELYKQIGTRKHVYVEGWTLLGSMLGVFPVTVWTHKAKDDATDEWRPPKTEIRTVTRHSKFCKKGKAGHSQHANCETYTKEGPVVIESGVGGWEARVEARTRTGEVVGAAEAECRWDESSWADRDSYALKSMAQTRATSKALRMPLGFIVSLAGFDATPAEEIPYHGYDDDGSPVENDTGYKCPSCGSAVYDNRADNAARTERGEKNWPAFKCKNTNCTGAEDGRQWFTWSASFFDDPVVKAKKDLVEFVGANTAAWKVYYPAEDPSYDKNLAEVVAAAHESGDPAQMAGVIWREMTSIASGGLVYEGSDDYEPTKRDLAIIVEAAKIAVTRAGDDANDIITPLDAVELALERSIDAAAEADAPPAGY